MKLFLTSAGLPAEITPDFLKLLGKKQKQAKVCFISTAAEPEENKKYVEKDKKRLLDLGLKITELDLKGENEDSLKKKFENFDVIFVEGGNTFYLLKYVRESGFNKVIGPFLERGGIYVGVSAGSYIACPDISTASWKHAHDVNIVGLKDLRAMSLVNFYIIPHYEDKYELVIKKNKNKVSRPIITLTDKQAVLVDGRKIRFVGPGEFKEFK